MSILSDLMIVLEPLELPVETGYLSGTPPDEYLVLIPVVDGLELYADNLPQAQVEEVRLSLFTKKNYIKLKNQLTRIFLEAGFSITERRYVGFEEDTKYHHYAIDVMKEYEMEVI